jgi:hypothetical protein
MHEEMMKGRETYIFEEVVGVGVDGLDDGVEVLDALDATVNQL